MNIEVEVRSFISKEQYNRLLAFFLKTASHQGLDEQETHYFDGKADVRIQKNKHFAKIWMKGGKMHEEARKETEIKVPVEDFAKLQDVFAALGFKTTVKWFRSRHAFNWNDLAVTVDYNKGYGYILELEKMATEATKDSTLKVLKEKMAELEISITPKEEFDRAYAHYVSNWEKLTADNS